MITTLKIKTPWTRKYSYQETIEAAQKVNWRIEDIIGGDKRLDFTKPFMPESLARMNGIGFLNVYEKRILNQIRGNTYLNIFGLVEEFILPFVMDHARPQLDKDDYRTRALLLFASEEAKHIHLFKRFREEFEAGFGTPCAVIGPPSEIARAILSHQPLAVALLILHIEWMTQRHYLESVKEDQDLDPQFKSLLRHHWMEEAQHAKLDTLMVEALAEGLNKEEIEKSVEEYIEMGGFLDGGLKQQVEFDIDCFERATGRKFSQSEREKLAETQHQANRWTYIGSGMTHQNFLSTLGSLSAEARERVRQIAPVFF
ncbi:MAG: hypothetical protein L0226_15765 [Acidobacteria bacterium]|nr:hypothetical protein [Acidobacteriota bacterium]MCI0662179.1 hypothetical protein [Acidobacteriota bacterium]